MTSKAYTFRIRRFDPARDEEPYHQDYPLDAPEGMTVLEALLRIQTKQDGTLAFRYACRGAVCGSCAMIVNGREELTCRIQVHGLAERPRTTYLGLEREAGETLSEASNVITIEPPRNLPAIKDPVVEMDSFFEKFEAVQPWLQPTGPDPKRERLVDPTQWAEAEPYTSCILCACCLSVCPVAEGDPDYLGPAALAGHYRFFSDVRDAAGERRLDLVNGEAGVWGCDMVWNCVEICPKGVPPTQGIGKSRTAIRRAERARKKTAE